MISRGREAKLNRQLHQRNVGKLLLGAEHDAEALLALPPPASPPGRDVQRDAAKMVALAGFRRALASSRSSAQ